jgi:hypothetical protein
MVISEEVIGPVLIRAYGEFWNPDLVNWKEKSGLIGIDPRKTLVDVYEQRGVYVLFDEYAPVYVGRAHKISIGYRLFQHRISQRKGPRWNRFSWFGFNEIGTSGRLRKLKPRVSVKMPELISTIEALLILIADPKLNSRREKLANAIRFRQSDAKKPMSGLEEQLQSIQQKLDQLVRSNVANSAS